jgi:hypothetical protein
MALYTCFLIKKINNKFKNLCMYILINYILFQIIILTKKKVIGWDYSIPVLFQIKIL